MRNNTEIPCNSTFLLFSDPEGPAREIDVGEVKKEHD